MACMMNRLSFCIRRLGQAQFQLDALRELFRDYNQYLGINLDFQNFEEELAQLPGRYAVERRGQLFLVEALETSQTEPVFVGCAGLYGRTEHQCEVKRVYVDPAYQGHGLGRQLMEAAIADARAYGYQELVLDSLRRLESARILYEKLGFQEIKPYNENPHDDVYYMALDLTVSGREG